MYAAYSIVFRIHTISAVSPFPMAVQLFRNPFSFVVFASYGVMEFTPCFWGYRKCFVVSLYGFKIPRSLVPLSQFEVFPLLRTFIHFPTFAFSYFSKSLPRSRFLYPLFAMARRPSIAAPRPPSQGFTPTRSIFLLIPFL